MEAGTHIEPCVTEFSARHPRSAGRTVEMKRSAASRANSSTAMTRTADRLMTLIWSSALSLFWKALRHYPSALTQPPIPVARSPPQVATSAAALRTAKSSGTMVVRLVMLPRGRDRLCTRPSTTGSPLLADHVGVNDPLSRSGLLAVGPFAPATTPAMSAARAPRGPCPQPGVTPSLRK